MQWQNFFSWLARRISQPRSLVVLFFPVINAAISVALILCAFVLTRALTLFQRTSVFTVLIS